MRNFGTFRGSASVVATVLILLQFSVLAATVSAQDAKTGSAPAAPAAQLAPATAAAQAESAPSAPAADEKQAAPDSTTVSPTAAKQGSENGVDAPAPSGVTTTPGGAAPTAAAEKSPESTGESQAPATQAGPNPPGATVPAPARSGLPPLVLAAMIIALFVVPVIVGNYLAKVWRMPDHAWKISLTLGIMAAASLVVSFGEFKFGPDLAGGITLVYELAPSSGNEVPIGTLIDALKQRVDPTSTREVTIRQRGSNAVEIIIPKTGADALQYVKRTITEMGQLEFRITAEPNRADKKDVIEKAKTLTAGQKDVMIGGQKKAEWVTYDEKEFGPPSASDNRILKRTAGEVPEALVLIDDWNVTGDDLKSATKGVDENGGPAVHFTFNNRGAAHFGQLTGDNLPNRATNTFRYLGIVLDKRLISAPRINSKITDNGMISGGGMTVPEVDHIVSILQSGKLPASLNKTPISEETISPTLGAVTVQQGKVAIGVSLAAIVLFMLVYYRFAGFVACMVLSFNLLLVLARNGPD